jgi:pimeloyl-ACP methyl ester carboxylesterase
MAEPNLTLRRRCVAQSVIGFAPQSELTKLCGFPPDARFGDKVNTAHQALYMRPAFQQAQLTEEENIYATSAEQLRAAQRSFGELPLIVLSAEGRVNPAETPEQRERKEMRARLMFKLHQQLAELSIHGVVRSVPNAGHNIHFDQPEAVIAAIMEVLDQAAKP